MLSIEIISNSISKYGPSILVASRNTNRNDAWGNSSQNTNWNNADIALSRLKEETSFNAQTILKMPLESLQQVIRSSGFYKNKAKAIQALLLWLNEHHFDYSSIAKLYSDNLRKELLTIRGIGEETADVLIVYIFKGKEFIPDSYTRRILENWDINIQKVIIN